MTITEKDINNRIDQLNHMLNLPADTYHIDNAYGGYKIVKYVGTGGGITDISHGYTPKRQVYNFLEGMLTGIQATEKTDD